MNQLCFEKLQQDPRVTEAKKLLLEAVGDQQKKLTGIKAADPERIHSYEEIIEKYSQYRGGKLWYPYLGSGIGNGALVELGDGSVKYDLICGIGPHYWGHSHHDIITASIDAAISDTVMQGHLQQNLENVELLELLLQISGMDHCFLSAVGAMACENAWKIIFQHKHPANRILAFEKCFMGRTLSMAQVTDKPAYREGLPKNLHVDLIPFFDPLNPEESTQNAVTTLKGFLEKHPGQHAGMAFELIQGEAGFIPGTHDFFVSLMEILKERDIPILVDEVQTFGRTTEVFAYQHFGLSEYIDVVTIGKLSQVCATLYKSRFKPRPGLLSQTFTASSSAIRSASVIIKGLLKGKFFGETGKIAKLHKYVSKHLQNLADTHPGLIEGPFGIGGMVAFTVFGGDKDKTLAFSHTLFEKGIIAFTAGVDPMRIRFLLPVGVITEKDIDMVMKVLEETLLEEGKQ